MAQAQQQLIDLFRELRTEAAKTGDIPSDVSPDELARYCLHALTAAGGLPSKAAVHRLVAITLAGLGARWLPGPPTDVGGAASRHRR